MNPKAVIERITEALSGVRSSLARAETELHDVIAGKLTAAGLAFEHEYTLGPRSRVDFLVEGMIGIEIKKGKVGSRALCEQAARYCGFDAIKGIVLVVERCVFRAPDEGELGKPVRYISLSRNWGVAP